MQLVLFILKYKIETVSQNMGSTQPALSLFSVNGSRFVFKLFTILACTPVNRWECWHIKVRCIPLEK